MFASRNRLAAVAMMAASIVGLGPAGTASSGSDRIGAEYQKTGVNAGGAKATTQRGGGFGHAMRSIFSSASTAYGWRYPKPGHSVRQGQRMARRRRNVQRNRAAHR